MLGVIAELIDGVVGYRDCPVVTRLKFNGRQFLVVLIVNLRIKEAALIFKIVGMIKALSDGHAIEVPFTRMIGSVVLGLE
jgi:hypothetical protein